MGKYNGAIVTTVGQNLIANAVASNQKVIFTKLKASTHVYASTTDFEAMTSISDIVQSVDISYAGVYNNNVIQVSGRFTNNGVVTPFTINTIGLYGKVGSGSETLVAIVTAVNADTMPVADPVSPTAIVYNIQMTVQNSGVMEVEVNDAGTINVHQFNDALYSTALITVPTTGWTASGSQYTKTIDVGGITSSSMPFVELQYPSNVTASQKKAIDKAASKLVSLTTTNYGQVLLTATEVPATSFNLLLRGLGSGQYTQPYNEFFTTVLDKEPYVSRTARDGLVKISQLYGATVAWNQLVHGDFGNDYTDYWAVYSGTGSVSNGELTVTNAVGRNGVKAKTPYILSLVAGHKYYTKFEYKSDVALKPYFSTQSVVQPSSEWKSVEKIMNVSSAESHARELDFFIDQAGQQGTFSLRRIMQIDLTLMFGTAIADYVYSLEQATEGSGLAWLRSYGFFTKDYYEYDAGSLQSVCTSGRKITALDGTVRTYPIDNEELRGLFKLDANNKLYADGDIYPPSGSGRRKYGIIDLGDLTWVYRASGASLTPYFYAEFDGIKSHGNPVTNKADIICSKYTTALKSENSFIDKSVCADGNTTTLMQLQIKDSAYTDAATFKTAMSGVYLVYELATETTFSADPYINPQRSEGTEEFVDGLTRDVMIPVGNESTYYLSEVLPIMCDYVDAMTASS